MKRFMVLGIGNAQLDLVLYLKERFYVVGCSNTEIGPAYQHLDAFEKVDVKNREEVLNKAIDYNVDYIYSVGSDVSMPTVAWVSEKLGLPSFFDYKTSLILSNKREFREKLKNIYGSVDHEILDANNLGVSNLDFPVIVKPVDSQGQRGVSKVVEASQLEKAYYDALQFSQEGKVIAEKYIGGIEISVNAFVLEGRVVFSVISDRISWPGHSGGAIHKHLIPSSVSPCSSKNIERMVKEVVDQLDIQNGPLYFQAKVMNDEAFLIEVAARLDGCHMWRLIKCSTGIDLLSLCVDRLQSKSKELKLCDSAVSPATLEFFCVPPGEVIKGDFSVHPKALYSQQYYNQGDKVQAMNGFKEKCGYQIYEPE